MPTAEDYRAAPGNRNSFGESFFWRLPTIASAFLSEAGSSALSPVFDRSPRKRSKTPSSISLSDEATSPSSWQPVSIKKRKPGPLCASCSQASHMNFGAVRRIWHSAVMCSVLLPLLTQEALGLFIC